REPGERDDHGAEVGRSAPGLRSQRLSHKEKRRLEPAFLCGLLRGRVGASSTLCLAAAPQACRAQTKQPDPQQAQTHVLGAFLNDGGRRVLACEKGAEGWCSRRSAIRTRDLDMRRGIDAARPIKYEDVAGGRPRGSRSIDRKGEQGCVWGRRIPFAD